MRLIDQQRLDGSPQHRNSPAAENERRSSARLGSALPKTDYPSEVMTRRDTIAAWAPVVERAQKGRVLVLTGAGISAESGIVTFRGKDGYWVLGSRNYTPQEMATAHMFEKSPEQVWCWYLQRFGECRKAMPNPAHRALVALEQHLNERFTLVTQNIDALHRRAGSSEARTLCIHGDSTYTRCAVGCTDQLFPLGEFGSRLTNTALSDDDRRRLGCPKCGGWLRPHVLWFDEYYDENHYRADSAHAAAMQADILLSIGTTGATSLPSRIAHLCASRGATLIDVNPEPNPFSELASRTPGGLWIRGTAAQWVPRLVEQLIGQDLPVTTPTVDSP